jgi:hypothetical protein
MRGISIEIKHLNPFPYKAISEIMNDCLNLDIRAGPGIDDDCYGIRGRQDGGIRRWSEGRSERR